MTAAAPTEHEADTIAPTDASSADAKVARVRNAIWLAALAGLTVSFALVPMLGGSLSFSFYMMAWIALATGLNIIAGFTGYMPLGYVAFYGIGAFTTAALTAKAGWLVYFALPMAGVAGVVLSLVLAPTLRLRGIYFAIVSLALAIILRLVVANLPQSITGGSFGLNLGADSEPVAAFYVMLCVMLGSVLAATWLAQSRLGKALRAIRDDPEAAETLGVDVPRTRLKAWMLSALVASLVGGVEAWYTNIVDPYTRVRLPDHREGDHLRDRGRARHRDGTCCGGDPLGLPRRSRMAAIPGLQRLPARADHRGPGALPTAGARRHVHRGAAAAAPLHPLRARWTSSS